MSSLVHHFVSAKPNPADTTLVRPQNWNEGHEFNPAITGFMVDKLGDNSFSGVTAATPGAFLLIAAVPATCSREI